MLNVFRFIHRLTCSNNNGSRRAVEASSEQRVAESIQERMKSCACADRPRTSCRAQLVGHGGGQVSSQVHVQVNVSTTAARAHMIERQHAQPRP